MTPNHGPKITGGQPRYQIGDTVRVNCTSSPSKPACQLNWFINGEPVQKMHLRHFDKIVVNRDGLEMSRLGLEFRVRGYHFKHGDMKLKVYLRTSFPFMKNTNAILFIVRGQDQFPVSAEQ